MRQGNERVPPPSCDCLTDPLLCLLVLVAGAANVAVAGAADLVRVCDGVAAGWEGDGDGEERSFLSEFTDRGRPLLCACANAMSASRAALPPSPHPERSPSFAIIKINQKFPES